MKFAVATVMLALLAAGCTTPDSGDVVARDHDRGPPKPSATLFISPSGQPFRAAPGEPYPVAKWFALADKNGDGRLDRAEFRADAEAFFHTLDENHDGVVDGFEVNDYEQKIAPEISGAYGSESGFGGVHRGGGQGRGGGRRGGAGGAGGPGGAGASSAADSVAVLQGAAVFGLLDEPEPVSATDLNLDGRITLSEFLTVADRRFDLLDAKHLGYLTLADLPKTAAQKMAEAKKR